MAQQATPRLPPPGSACAATISPATETCSFTFVTSSSFSSVKNGGLQLLIDSGCSSHMVDLEMIPNADQHLREYQALQPPKIVYGDGSHELLATGAAKLTIGVENTAAQPREVNMSVMLVPGVGRNLLSSSAALSNGVETIISAFPALRARGENFPLRADHSLYFLDALLPELPSEYANVGETSSVMWHRLLGRINAQRVKKLAEEKGTGIFVKDTDCSVSTCDICTLAKSKQQNHAKVARIEVTQPLRASVNRPIRIHKPSIWSRQ